MRFSEDMLLLYAVTDRSLTGKLTLYRQVEQALQGGVTMVQLREKNLTEAEIIAQAKELLNLCHSYNVPLIINDSVDIALKVGADGVHVGIEDTPVAEIRKKAGSGFIIGATAKTVEQAQSAEAAGADYLGVGAVFPSPTKQNAIRITTHQLKAICGSVKIPAVAIGGIGLHNMEELRGGGMKGFAIVSAIFGAEDIKTAAEKLIEKAQELCR